MDTTASLQIRPLAGTAEELKRMQEIFTETAEYTERVMGRPPVEDEASRYWAELLPSMSASARKVYGFWNPNTLVGFLDVVQDYPEPGTAFLGLLMVSKPHQGEGVGRKAYLEVEKILRQDPSLRRLLVGVALSNRAVVPFWQKMGYSNTGQLLPYTLDHLTSAILVFEKSLC